MKSKITEDLQHLKELDYSNYFKIKKGHQMVSL